MIFIIVITIVLLSIWAAEYFNHKKNLFSIPIRVHVNGTRGKSSVTRLIAAGLRAGGIRTMAKTTGTLPRIIDDKGFEVPITRPHMVNIIEQLRIVDYMKRRSPQAMVMECMAVHPEYQWVCETKMIHATVGVITNARMDHILEMGPTLKDITLSLCNTLPKNGIAFTSEEKMFPLMQTAAKKNKTELIGINGEGVTPEEMSGFTYLEHPDNVGLALKVCEYLGIDRTTALKGMHLAYPDVGAMKIFRLDFGFRKVYFINALAANDPQSTFEIWRRVEQMFPERVHLTVMLNTRADRFDRSIQLLEMLKSVPVDKIALVGQKQDQVNMNAMRLKFPKNQVIPIKSKELHNIYDSLLATCSPEGLSIIFGIGNMGQGGLQIADYFRHKYISMRDKTEATQQLST